MKERIAGAPVRLDENRGCEEWWSGDTEVACRVGCQRSGQAAPLDAAHRSRVSIGRLPGRGYVEPTQAVWELLEDAVEPANADIERR